MGVGLARDCPFVVFRKMVLDKFWMKCILCLIRIKRRCKSRIWVVKGRLIKLIVKYDFCFVYIRADHMDATMTADTLAGLHLRHAALERNKDCLLAYM